MKCSRLPREVFSAGSQLARIPYVRIVYRFGFCASQFDLEELHASSATAVEANKEK